MLKNYFKIALRNLWKQKFFTALNMFGLSLGLAGGLILFQFINFHLSFDNYHRNAGGLYRVVTDLHLDDGSVINVAGTPLGLTTALQAEVPQVKDQAVLLKLHTATVEVPAPGKSKFFTEHENIGFTDQHWFNLFDYGWQKGSAQTSLSAPNTVVITLQLADKYFGAQDPIGKTIMLDNKYLLTVTGILKDNPANTDTRTDMFISRSSFKIFYPDVDGNMNKSWGFINSTTISFVWLPGGVPGKKINDALAGITKRNFDPSVASVYYFHLQPLKEVHFDGRYGGTMQKSLLTILAAIGLFLVIIACFNFINLATAQSAKRAREIGTRKVLGGTPASIVWQFMAETFSVVLLAATLSFFWIIVVLPVLNNWLQIKLAFNFLQDRNLLLCIIILLGFVTIAGGFYPAFILSRFKPVDTLKKQVSNAQTAVYRKGLIVIQNVIVQVLIICTLIITLQVRHLKTANLGFDKEAVLMVPIPGMDKSKLSYLANQLKTNPGIRAISFCFQSPSSDARIGGSVSYDNRSWEDFSVSSIVGDTDYLNTFKLQLVTGRNLQASDTIREFLINETLVQKLGIKDPQQVIGRRLVAGGFGDHPGTIVGVLKNFNIHSLYSSIEPLLMTTNIEMYHNVALKLNGNNQAATREMIEKVWQSVYPENVFEYHYLNEQIDNFYHKEDLLNRLINATAVIAIVISCLGLLGLISFFSIQRTKEIGIRKVLGAGVANIVYLLLKEFLVLLLVSIVIASPVAWYFMNRWLQEFAYKLNISWWMFALAGITVIAIALITVSFQAIKAALANPVDSLRME